MNKYLLALQIISITLNFVCIGLITYYIFTKIKK